MRKITLEECEVEIDYQPETDVAPEGSFATGDDEKDAEICNEIRERIERGDTWAWFCVSVKVTWRDKRGREYSGTDSLGGCSYKDEKDAESCVEEHGMVANALDYLNSTLANVIEDAKALEAELGEEFRVKQRVRLASNKKIVGTVNSIYVYSGEPLVRVTWDDGRVFSYPPNILEPEDS